jgi:transcriptional regulator
MYVPELFGDASAGEIQEIVEKYSFATLIVHGGDKLEVSHLPLALDGTLAGGILRGHMARANPQLALCTGQTRAIAIFHGPHAHVSPSWYAKPSVPTWNYIAVHCHGSLHLEDTAIALEQSLELMMNKYETDDGRTSVADLPSDQRARALSAIQSFYLRIERVEAKFKLSQNRSPEDRGRVIERLGRSGSNAELVEWMVRQAAKPKFRS